MQASETDEKIYTLKPSGADVYATGWDLAWGSFFILFCLFCYNKDYGIVLVLLMALSFKFYIFQSIDLLFTKQFVQYSQDKAYLKLFHFKWHFNREKGYLVIEDLFIPSTIKSKNPTLILYRNNPSLYSRLVKNKIKLHAIEKANLEQTKAEARKISAMFGIPFRDIYE